MVILLKILYGWGILFVRYYIIWEIVLFVKYHKYYEDLIPR